LHLAMGMAICFLFSKCQLYLPTFANVCQKKKKWKT
jgi:hypothetical protein